MLYFIEEYECKEVIIVIRGSVKVGDVIYYALESKEELGVYELVVLGYDTNGILVKALNGNNKGAVTTVSYDDSRLYRDRNRARKHLGLV